MLKSKNKTLDFAQMFVSNVIYYLKSWLDAVCARSSPMMLGRVRQNVVKHELGICAKTPGKTDCCVNEFSPLPGHGVSLQMMIVSGFSPSHSVTVLSLALQTTCLC